MKLKNHKPEFGMFLKNNSISEVYKNVIYLQIKCCYVFA